MMLQYVQVAAAPRSRVLAVTSILLMIIALLPIGAWVFPRADLGAQTGREAVLWVLSILLIGYVGLIERRALASIGLRRPRWMSLLIGIAAAALMIAGMAFIYLVLFPAFQWSDSEPTATILSMPLWFRIALVVRAATFEEILFRGFMIERLSEITGRRWLAAVLSFAAFTLAHLSHWGWAHLLIAGFGGLVLTGLYLWRRDLFANMIAGHVIILALIGLIFLFGYLVAPAALLMALFIMFLEILVAFIQAFVFSLLAAVFIGQIRAAHH